MSNETSPTPAQPQTISVTEAAHRLGVSERTVYRRLQAGKLHRADVSDNRLTQVVTGTEISSQNQVFMSDIDSEMSDITSEDTWNALWQELKEKDRLIASLLENQREMIQAIQQMQQQMHELSSWVLAQKSEPKPETEPIPAAYAKVQPQEKASRAGWIAKLLHRRSHSSRQE
jgi:excisionase family DNA binding protein